MIYPFKSNKKYRFTEEQIREAKWIMKNIDTEVALHIEHDGLSDIVGSKDGECLLIRERNRFLSSFSSNHQWRVIAHRGTRKCTDSEVFEINLGLIFKNIASGTVSNKLVWSEYTAAHYKHSVTMASDNTHERVFNMLSSIIDECMYVLRENIATSVNVIEKAKAAGLTSDEIKLCNKRAREILYVPVRHAFEVYLKTSDEDNKYRKELSELIASDSMRKDAEEAYNEKSILLRSKNKLGVRL